MLDDYFMNICLEEASIAFEEGEVPVGTVLINRESKILSRTHNKTICRNSPVAHAEILAIEEASKKIGNYRLLDCTLYVSKEPCIMCAGAIIEARISNVVFGCYDSKRGALVSLIDINCLPLNHKISVKGGVLEERSREILQRFFAIRRGTEAVIPGPTRNRLYAS